MIGNRFAPPKRTDADRLGDALRFIASARPVMLLAHTPDSLCAQWGVTKSDNRRLVECRLLAAQDRERRRQA